MRSKLKLLPVLLGFAALHALSGAIAAQGNAPAPPTQTAADPVKNLVNRLNVDHYKATIKTLTQFGDRRQGTERNRNAINWIEQQLETYGCANIERLKYDYQPPNPDLRSTMANTAGGPGKLTPPGSTSVGGGTPKGLRVLTGINNDPNAQPDPKLRALDTPRSVPGAREEIYCTKVGATHPEEMYIVGAHMDGIGWGEAANDDGSGTALVMELARVLSGADVRTDRSIRFILWNNEETGLDGSGAYVKQRKDLQGKEDPPGSGRYPEPKWLGMIQHDMMMFDHGMPRADGTVSKEQRPEADINIEFQVNSKFAVQSQALAWTFEQADEKYASDYPASVASHMTNTDSNPFMNEAAAISLRENERGTEIGNGWDPQWHQPTDLFKTYNDQDFLLGLNAAQTTLAATAKLAGATIAK
jgi:hypothetical protein